MSPRDEDTLQVYYYEERAWREKEDPDRCSGTSAAGDVQQNEKESIRKLMEERDESVAVR